ncbi:SPOC domain-like protein [Gigaspora margarita]|uniref:ATP-dependent DNA helicase II subunit 2 n=1 Tax=Gigaspora margarita TaxID=4874 RepID=A0A8H3X412_GIGMA|nr:SPOC domain-like protein [Gigaspora margarita]
MADKKVTIYIIDVGPTMWQVERKPGVTGLDLARKAVLIMLEAKVITGLKSDVTSLLLFGTDDTNNYMNDQTGGYEHVTTLYPIEQPSMSILRTVNNNLPHGKVKGDAFDALIVALGMIDLHCRNLKFKKKIYLLTDGESPINSSDFDAVLRQINESNVELNILGIGFDDPEAGFSEENKSEVKRQSETFFNKIVSKCPQATIFSMEETLKQLSKPHIRTVRPIPLFKGALTLNDTKMSSQTSLSINVEMYSRTTKVRPLKSTKYSALAEATTTIHNKTSEVNMSRTYTISVVDNDKNEAVEVPREELNKAYSLGKTLIPVNEADEEVFTMVTTKSMEVVGFVKSNEFKREYLMSAVAAVVPQTNNLTMAQRLSALIHALYEKDSFAIVRYVKKNDDPPKLGILIPYIRAPKECLYFCRIPFKEDCHHFTFPSFDRVVSKSGKELTNHNYLPNDEMLEKMDRFIDGMDLMSAAKDEGNAKEYLKVKECFNPVIVQTKKATCHRALYPDDPLLQPDQEMIAQTQFLPSLIQKNLGLANDMRTLFNIKKVNKEKGKTGKRRFADANKPSSQELSLEEILNKPEEHKNGKRVKSGDGNITDALIQHEVVREVGTIDPISNFQAMIANRQDDLVSTAVEQMSVTILHFVKTSFAEGLYPKALECLKILRQACAKENETSKFNNFLKELKTTCFEAQPSKTDFWDLIVREKITLINRDEASDSTMSIQEAEEFLRPFEKKSNTDTLDEDAVATDDLFKLMED